MPVTIMETLRLHVGGEGYALLNTQVNEWARIPLFIANEWRGNHYITTRGPFVFRDGFAETDEAHYLLSMLQYTELTPRAAKKVNDIFTKYEDWITKDEEVTGYLRRNFKWL